MMFFGVTKLDIMFMFITLDLFFLEDVKYLLYGFSPSKMEAQTKVSTAHSCGYVDALKHYYFLISCFIGIVKAMPVFNVDVSEYC